MWIYVPCVVRLLKIFKQKRNHAQKSINTPYTNTYYVKKNNNKIKSTTTTQRSVILVQLILWYLNLVCFFVFINKNKERRFRYAVYVFSFFSHVCARWHLTGAACWCFNLIQFTSSLYFFHSCLVLVLYTKYTVGSIRTTDERRKVMTNK